MGTKREIPEARIIRLYGELSAESQRIVYGLLKGQQPKVKAVATKRTSKKAAEQPKANGSDDDSDKLGGMH